MTLLSWCLWTTRGINNQHFLAWKSVVSNGKQDRITNAFNDPKRGRSSSIHCYSSSKHQGINASAGRWSLQAASKFRKEMHNNSNNNNAIIIMIIYKWTTS